ncbi:hypothetical protein GCM10027169_31280 [Gordonia jinhuaensis]|uniref:HTH tetR-type domain-containing protein n=1 Tax=Gordonia jinhuaensis TaxID=1517702 RepID=A0A916T685_9ACTN|nr:TetR/AcrR family transcriptional regulator [Gordonia jinhuaensis]GGB33517.1 hypothetical protein GCM10011489_22080 [Gordonia jinhuaensis]
MQRTSERKNRPYAARMPTAQRRDQLLDAVLAVIVDRGVGAVTVDAVAQRAGVTRPVVYGQFADANDLLRHSLRREEQRAYAQLGTALDLRIDTAHGDADTRRDALTQALDRLTQAFLEAVTDHPDRWRAILLVADSSTPQLHARIDRARAGLVAGMAEALTQAGVFDADTDVEMIAHSYVATLWEFARVMIADPQRFPAQRLRAAVTAAFAPRIRSGR